ncbi:glutamate-tRNA ligase [Rickenella mellea]|uniref:glutamate--tRNA ligase n=1 Tax=Rickenella mellea TaxID=50990 RepID=A0A4R5XEK2_9AGAM|nr:glutamate-tRNA ligase [Rickenella mellea]
MPNKLSVALTSDPFPYGALGIASFIKTILIDFDRASPGLTIDTDGVKKDYTAEGELVRALASIGGIDGSSVQGDALVALARSLSTVTDFKQLTTSLDTLDDHLALRTFLVGHELSVADWLVWGSIKGSLKPLGVMKGGKHPHLLRWYTYIETLDSTQSILSELADARSRGVKSKSHTASSFTLGLQDAVRGQVVTRFPPEPSGYLHIGHLKAAILNQHFAEMYDGKLIVRFEDTNPSKEKSEFEDSILEDLAALGIRGDRITHTSDHFDKLYECALQMINTGNAYTDDTEREQMQKERMDGIPSARRDAPISENLANFMLMTKGTPEGLKFCLRAKLSVDDPNKAMRDPVIYRCNVAVAHHRTGDKWKVYPTYDFACPVVDAIEGVTHALRTNEYRDRNPQYHWMLDALGLRKVNIWDFSRLGFVYTFLSKRKLRDCLELGLARGWDDPRFPTFRGIRRRGMTVTALRQYMLAQGPSQNQILLEWDSIWSMNKKIIDPVAPRFCALVKEGIVKVHVAGAHKSPQVVSVPKHKKNPDVGTKSTILSDTIYVEQVDALTFAVDEEITLMDWGNAIVRTITRNAKGGIESLDMELHLSGDVKTTDKKITWLSVPSPPQTLPSVTLLDYDFLITKRKLEKDDSVESCANKETEFRVDAFADGNVKDLRKGDVLQFERKGYFVVDAIISGEEKGKEGGEWRMECIRIPDGRAAGLALKAVVSDAAVKEEPAVTTKMYKVPSVYGDDVKIVPPDVLYKVKPVYDA